MPRGSNGVRSMAVRRCSHAAYAVGGSASIPQPRGVMETQVGQPVDQQVLDRDMRRVYGTGDFEHVGYRFLEEPGKRILAIDAAEKSWGPNYLRLGLGLSSDFKGDSFFNLLGSYRMTWLNDLGGEFRTDAQVGRTNRL